MEIVWLSKDHQPVVCIGDWLTIVVRLQAGEEAAQKLWKETYQCFNGSSGDLDKLFKLFLDQADHVFSYLKEAHTKGEVTFIEEKLDPKTKVKVEHKMKKQYAEVVKQVEEFFIVLISIITESEDAIKRSNEVPTGDFNIMLIKTLKASGEFAELRLRMLQFLYNSLGPDSQFRYPVFMSILKYAATNRLFSHVVQYIDYIDEWLSVATLNTSQKRTLFHLIVTELKTLNKLKESYVFAVRLAEEFQGSPARELDEPANVKAAITLVVDSVKLPHIMYMDHLVKLHTVTNLSKNGNQVALDLLDVFLKGDKADLDNFFKNNKEFCETHELDYTASLQKWRLLSLAGCGSGQQDTVPLTTIAASLGLPLEETEELVVQAIVQNVLDAKIDQINKAVLVRSAMKREFGQKDWEGLQTRLGQWQNNIEYIQEVLSSRRSC